MENPDGYGGCCLPSGCLLIVLAALLLPLIPYLLPILIGFGLVYVLCKAVDKVIEGSHSSREN